MAAAVNAYERVMRLIGWQSVLASPFEVRREQGQPQGSARGQSVSCADACVGCRIEVPAVLYRTHTDLKILFMLLHFDLHRRSFTPINDLNLRMGVQAMAWVAAGRFGVSVLSAATMATSALAAGAADAAPKNSFADASRTITTADGWQVTATKSKERLRSVPPLNQSSWTREGFLDLKASAKIAGKGVVPVTAGTLTAVLHVGCNTDISSGLTTGISFGPSVGLSVSWPPSATLGAQVTPSVSTTFKPGTITDVTLGSKKLADIQAGTEVQGVHLRVDGCLGPVAVRTAVTVAISTPRNDNTITVYGQPHYL